MIPILIIAVIAAIAVGYLVWRETDSLGAALWFACIGLIVCGAIVLGVERLIAGMMSGEILLWWLF